MRGRRINKKAKKRIRIIRRTIRTIGMLRKIVGRILSHRVTVRRLLILIRNRKLSLSKGLISLNMLKSFKNKSKRVIQSVSNKSNTQIYRTI